jgi:hypothetical protein
VVKEGQTPLTRQRETTLGQADGVVEFSPGAVEIAADGANDDLAGVQADPGPPDFSAQDGRKTALDTPRLMHIVYNP